MDGAWVILTDAEMDTVWVRFYPEFNFRPSVRQQDWPGIKEPVPSSTYIISSVYGKDYQVLEQDLNIKTLSVLQKCVAQGGRLYALDWQHPCHWLYPHSFVDAQRPQAWEVPVLPNGGYY